MADPVKFIDVKIKVNGQVHNVKVEQGVSFGKYDESVFNWRTWTTDAKGLKSLNEKRTEYYSSIYSINRSNELEMTEAEFAIFKNIADNDGNGGNLTKKDITKAQELYRAGKFTADISKNLPKGFHAEKESQDIEKNGVGASISDYSLAHELADENYKLQVAHVNFESKEDSYTKHIEKLIAESTDGKVEIEEVGEGEGTYYTVLGKDGVKRTYHYDGYGEDMEDVELISEQYTDDNGTVITNNLEMNDVTKVTTINGKTITEFINKNDEKYSYIEIEYEENGKHITERRDINKNLRYKDVKYEKGGKEYSESYNSNNKLTRRTYNTKGKEDYVTEEYDNGVLKYRNSSKLEEHFEKGKCVYSKKTLSDKKGNFAGWEVKSNGKTSIYDKNSKLVKVGNFDVKKYATQNVTEKGKEYEKSPNGTSSYILAQEIKKQIDGPSFNSKTFDLIDSVPGKMIADVIQDYRELKSFWAGQKPLFVALYEEWGVSKEDIMKRLKEKCAQLLMTRQNQTLKPSDYKLLQKLEAGCPEGEDFKKYIKEVEDLFVQ